MKNIVCLTVLAAAFCFAANLFAEEAAVAAPVAKTTVTTAGCPCVPCAAPNPCACPPVVYRVGLFGHIRPVVYAPPVYRPYYYRCAYPCYPQYCW